MGKKEEAATAARDFMMARLAACRGSISTASEALDEMLSLMNSPDDDKAGKRRAELLEMIDDLLGQAAISIQHAQPAWSDVDHRELEPEIDEDDDEAEDEDEDDEDE